MEYKKIKLRDFRRNLTFLKDSLASGEIYEVVDRGNPLAYFIPVDYQVKIQKKEKNTEFIDIVDKLVGSAKLKDVVQKDKYYKKTYKKLLEKKYL